MIDRLEGIARRYREIEASTRGSGPPCGEPPNTRVSKPPWLFRSGCLAKPGNAEVET